MGRETAGNTPLNRFTLIAVIKIDRITAASAVDFMSVRLLALQESPLAFGSTFAQELQFSASDWERRANQWNSNRAAGFLARATHSLCGIAGCFIDESDQSRAHLISMWVHPEQRRRGTGRLLISSVAAWAASRNASQLRLTVTCSNTAAIHFYAGLGFVATGSTEPYPNDAALVENEMICDIAGFVAPKAL